MVSLKQTGKFFVCCPILQEEAKDGASYGFTEEVVTRHPQGIVLSANTELSRASGKLLLPHYWSQISDGEER